MPLLPEAEFTRTVRGAGIEESGWLLGFASPEQRVAAVDLDCWRDFRLSAARLFEWIDAMLEAGPETLAAALTELDPELWVVVMKRLGRFSVGGIGELPPGEGSTLDGIVFYDGETGECEERIEGILTAALHHAPAHYWRLVYAAISESEHASLAFASRWQRGRLADLGFPEREQAMHVYRPLSLDALREPAMPPTPPASTLVERVADDESGELARALAGLEAGRAETVMQDVLILANALAVADALPLTAPETAERSLAKAVRGIERGLAALSRSRGLPSRVWLEAVPARDLFRIGATLEPALQPRAENQELSADDDDGDWGIITERLDPEDLELG